MKVVAKPDPRCLINRKKQYVFINVPKNASTSIRNTVQFDEFINFNTIKNPDMYFKFMVIRNPIYRAISSYLEVSKLRKDGRPQMTQNSAWYKEPNKAKSFMMFLDFIDGNFYDPHTIPQVNFLKDKNLTIDDIDIKLLHESITEDFNTLIANHKRIIVKCKLPKMQVGAAATKGSLTKLVEGDEGIQKRILEIYPEDAKIYDDIKSVRVD